MHRLYGLGMTPNPNNDSVGSGASGSPSNNAASVSDAPDLGDPANIGGGTGEAGASSSAQAPKPSVPVRDEKENTEGQTAVGPVEALTLTAAPGEEPAGVSEAPVPGQALTLAAAPGEEPAGVSEAPTNILTEIFEHENGAALSPVTPVELVEVISMQQKREIRAKNRAARQKFESDRLSAVIQAGKALKESNLEKAKDVKKGLHFGASFDKASPSPRAKAASRSRFGESFTSALPFSLAHQGK